MRLSWKDAVATLLGVAGAAVLFVVVRDWGWPLLGSYRMGVLALGAIGIAMCTMSGIGEAAGTKSFSVTLGGVLGSVAGIVFVIGLITGSETLLLTLAALMAILWGFTTIHHTAVSLSHGPTAEHA